jgi:hypothetical protein
MVGIPSPRRPGCGRHHVWMVGCADCMAEMRGRRAVTRCPHHPVHTDGCEDCAHVRDAERNAADKRLRQAGR